MKSSMLCSLEYQDCVFCCFLPFYYNYKKEVPLLIRSQKFERYAKTFAVHKFNCPNDSRKACILLAGSEKII